MKEKSKHTGNLPEFEKSKSLLLIVILLPKESQNSDF